MKTRRIYTLLLALILLLSATLAEAESAEEQVLVFKTPCYKKGFGDRDLADAFNQTHPGKRIVVEEISDEQLLATEIMSGEADYMIDGCYLDPFKYSNSGEFYDIYEWMDADPDFHREDYYENIFTAMECSGHLYVMPAAFRFAQTVYLNGTIVEALGANYQMLDVITPSEVLDLYESAKAQGLMDEDTPLVFDDEVAPGTLLITSTEYANHIDLNAKTTNFSTSEFISLLERSKQAYTERRIEDGWGVIDAGSFSEAVTRHETDSLIKFSFVGLFRDPLSEGRLDKTPEGLMGPLVLYPDNGGGIVNVLTAYMVPKSCSNPELAWEFMKFCISPLDLESIETVETLEEVDQTFFGACFPLSKENMVLYAKLYETFGSADFDTSLAKLEERINEVSIFTYFIQSIEGLLMPIVSQYYDYGFISAEECAKQMDGRAYLYLNE